MHNTLQDMFIFSKEKAKEIDSLTFVYKNKNCF
jgi:hypothetical protein